MRREFESGNLLEFIFQSIAFMKLHQKKLYTFRTFLKNLRYIELI